MTSQVLADPAGRLRGAAPALPGAAHALRAAGTHGLRDALAQTSIGCGADQGYPGAPSTVRVPSRGCGQRLSVGQQAVHRAPAKIRAVGEQAVATVKTWRLLGKLRCCTTWITSLVQAVRTSTARPPTEVEKGSACVGAGAAASATIGTPAHP